jgi:disulfide bond formation protein DsbB
LSASPRQAWLRTALLFGAGYFLIGRLFTLPADNVHVWRLAAWLVSGVAFAAHIAYEHFGLRNSPRPLALHVALAVAMGAVGLAIAGMIHSLRTTSVIRPAWLLALVIWPAVTAIPAFLGALVAGAALARLSQTALKQ